MVQTFTTPNKIVDKYLDEQDKSAIIRHITSCQKNDSDWGTYRKKIPDELLREWAKVMAECWSYGFVAPYVYDDKLYWKRIVMHDVSCCDKCTLCPMNFRAGQCKGKIYYKANGERVFRTCWEN